MPINDDEKIGIKDLLLLNEQYDHIVLQCARSITKNVCDITTVEEAFEFIFTHVDSVESLLNKRCITKEILFKYLHSKKIPVSGSFTKLMLINKTTEYWHNELYAINELRLSSVEVHYNEGLNNQLPVTEEHQNIITTANFNENCAISEVINEDQYPINLLARKFSEWFFQNYNESNLKTSDFWSDVRLQLQITANDTINDQNYCNSNDVIAALMNSKMQYGLFFNPNLTHTGVQGRMDKHGLVLVLICGTLHTDHICVGVFECNFGLLRDPFAENNWKVKTIQCILRSQKTENVPSLYESVSLRNALEISVSMEEFP